ncbi:MAG TPA: hypothetical protein VF480_11020 [Verrucomicrobiae bacterium]
MKLATQNRDEWRVAGDVKKCSARTGISRHTPHVTRHTSAFTLAEVLAAMLFLAIVIPVAVEALHVSSLAGEVAARKGAAARIADRVLNESLVTTNWTGNAQNGRVSEGAIDYRWTVSVQNWPQQGQGSASRMNRLISMDMLTAQVFFQAQGRDYSVTLSTLANFPTQLGSATTSTR